MKNTRKSIENKKIKDHFLLAETKDLISSRHLKTWLGVDERRDFGVESEHRVFRHPVCEKVE